jgi:prolyl 4-hydroxylase
MDPSVAAFQNQLAIMGQRVATCLTYLNDDYDGGETDFPRIGWRFRGKTGDALLFANVTSGKQPDPLTLHAGLPVTRGRKYLLSQWIRDRVQAIV